MDANAIGRFLARGEGCYELWMREGRGRERARMGGGADDGETVVATRTGLECEGCSEARAHVYEWRRSVVWTRAVSLSREVLRPEVHYGKRRIRAPVSVLTPLSKDSVHHSTHRERLSLSISVTLALFA